MAGLFVKRGVLLLKDDIEILEETVSDPLEDEDVNGDPLKEDDADGDPLGTVEKVE